VLKYQDVSGEAAFDLSRDVTIDMIAPWGERFDDSPGFGPREWHGRLVRLGRDGAG
jgi:hypothetical protein